MIPTRPHLLPPEPDVPADLVAQVRADHDRFAGDGLPEDLEGYLKATYGLDMTATYAGATIRNPWGKASGQLSLNESQVDEAAEAGLGFVVLKTVIARDAAGLQSMSAWAIKESRMIVEPIRSPATGANGWTVTWKGRGWWQSFDDYLELVRASCAIGRRCGLLVIPSVKYHLPASADEPWREEEYVESTRAPGCRLPIGRRPDTMPLGEGLPHRRSPDRVVRGPPTRNRPRLAGPRPSTRSAGAPAVKAPSSCVGL